MQRVQLPQCLPVQVPLNYGGGQTETGKVYVPPATESFTHDADGNLTVDGRWTYSWDAENRLVQMIRDTDSPAGARQKLVFEYDHQGRRIRKQYFTGSDWQEQADTIFLYDGWNLVAELNANASNARVRTYVWGTDLSGTMQGAGGVGGLLKLAYYGTSTTNAFVAYDGNGNVAALIDAANGSICARYEYGPFAEPIRSSGLLSKLNPIRFSTKYTDNESGFLYYGYRYYNPSTGRWLSRDGVEEEGGLNLYGFLRHDPIVDTDYLGQWNEKVHLQKTTFWAGQFFKQPYSQTIGNADQGVDALFGGHSSLGPEQDRHMYYIKEGKDSRDWWYDTELARANELLARADKENNVSCCAKAAEAFGQGLHSRQDRSAHRPHPNGGNWPAGRMHPGWWDAWDESDYTAYGWSDVYWRKDINKPPLYYPWAKYTSEAPIQAQQRQLQGDARVTVIKDSFGALGEFEAAVRKSCLCKEAMLLFP